MRKKKVEEKMSFENEQGTSNNVDISEELSVDMVKGQVINFYDEKKAFEMGLEQAEKNLENFEKQWLIDKRLYELQLENWGLKEGHKTHKIHDVQEYWDLSKEQFIFGKVRPDTFQAERMIESYKDEIKNAKARIVSIDEELEILKAQLIEVGEEMPPNPNEE